MAWMIQSNSEGPVIIADIGLTFTAKQIKNVDLIGRHNAEQSNDLKLMIQKCFLKEIRKDPSEQGGGIDPKVVQQLQDSAAKAQEHAFAAAEVAAEQTQKIQNLEQQNNALKQQNEELHTKMDSVLNEVKAFSEKFPMEIKVIAEAMRNASAEHAHVAAVRQSLPSSGDSEQEIKTQERILALKEKKLEKNIKNLGSTISHTATDAKESLDALDQLGI